MNRATRIFSATFGTIMALAGLEHGIGEVLQGSGKPGSILIQSWPGSPFFSPLSGEPALTVIPNLLVTGVLAILLSLALPVWSIRFVHVRHGGLGMILICAAMLLAGGGVFPPILGMLVGLVATRIHAPLKGWRHRFSSPLGHFLAWLWPWVFTACVLSWFCMVPGIPVLAYFFGVENETLILALLVTCLGTLFTTAWAGFARDSIRSRPVVDQNLPRSHPAAA